MSLWLFIRDEKISSETEFLIFTSQAGEDGMEVRIQDENVWLTQKLIAKLFDVKIPTINEHLKNIFSSGELDANSVIRNSLITAEDGKKDFDDLIFDMLALHYKALPPLALLSTNKIIMQYSRQSL